MSKHLDPVIRKRRFSRDLGINLCAAMASLQLPTLASSSISLRASGMARLIFHSDPTSFEGVLITDDDGETFSVKGTPSKTPLSNEQIGGRTVDVNLTDGETGQLFIIRNVDLLPPPVGPSVNAEEIPDDPGNEMYKTLSKKSDMKLLKAKSSGLLTSALDDVHSSVQEYQEVPRYELRSDALKFETEEILVGNRADKEIRAYLTPTLVSRLLNVHVGRMKVEFNTAITPPPTPVYRKGSAQSSVCSNGDAANGTPSTTTDADINFLM